MNKETKQKETHKHREQTGDYNQKKVKRHEK